MSNRKRFIAGAVCPECQAQDTLAMWREDNVDVVQCVTCGHLERRRTRMRSSMCAKMNR